jgi:hypothetical protein
MATTQDKRTPARTAELRRLARIKTQRDKLLARERQELERIKQKLRDWAGDTDQIVLAKFERDILLRALEPQVQKRGAPQVMGEPHELIASHYRWLRKHDKSAAAKRVANLWGVSEATVRKCVRQHKSSALEEYMRTAEGDPTTRPAWAVDQLFHQLAADYRKLGE